MRCNGSTRSHKGSCTRGSLWFRCDVLQNLVSLLQSLRAWQMNFENSKKLVPMRRFGSQCPQGSARSSTTRYLNWKVRISKKIQDATYALENLLGGQVLTKEHSIIWHDALRTNGIARRTLKDLSREHNCVLIVNRTLRQVRFFGPSKNFEVACTAVSAALNALSATQDHEDKNVSQADVTEGDCPVCLSPAENVVVTRCGHCYCLDCFELQCRNWPKDQKQMSMKCSSCDEVLTLKEVRSMISSTAFENLLQEAFEVHLTRYPDRFRYCQTPDCTQIYRLGVAAEWFSCTNCFKLSCTGCHEQHHGVTCAEYKDIKSEGYEALALWMSKNNAKHCPKCATPMEKTDGCNHMQCTGCRAHLCWVCLMIFEESGPCYWFRYPVHLLWFTVHVVFSLFVATGGS